MEKYRSRIYTRTGDDGSTALADGSRLGKDELRLEVLGCVDELNSLIGLAIAHDALDLRPMLLSLQHQLFELGAEIAAAGTGTPRVGDDQVSWLEQQLDRLADALPALREFLLPGGTKAAACCHLARAVCRRCERQLVRLSRREQVNSVSIEYVNRLSDLLFQTARTLARHGGVPETPWDKEHRRP